MFEKVNRKLERLFILVTSWILFLKKEKEYGGKGFNFKRFNLLQKGFRSHHSIPFDYKNNKYSDYVSDLENIKIAYINYPYGRLLRDKLVFSNFFNSYFKTPECYCVINNGKLRPVNTKIRIDSVLNLIDFAKQKKLIFKPVLGTAGKGIVLLESDNNGGLLMNNKSVCPEDITNFVGSLTSYLVTEFIQQGEFSNNFFPGSANTIRLVTFCDAESDFPFVVYSFMRFGRKKSIPADNISQGGIFSMIDVKSGELSQAFEITPDHNHNILTHHPDTDVLIKGVRIPGWNELKDFFVKTGELIKPFIKVVGWDIILTDNSFVVIEGNNGPDLDNAQAAGSPFAKIPGVYKFLKSYYIR